MKDQVPPFFTNLDLPLKIVLFFLATANPTLNQERTIIRKHYRSINTKIETSTTVLRNAENEKNVELLHFILLVNIL